jgi:hypothetical protein
MKNVSLPHFYAVPIFLAVCLKSGVDAFFEVNAVKYLYFFLLLFGVFFLRTGKGFDRKESVQSRSDLQSVLWVFVFVYFSFLVLLMILQNGAPQMVFKIVSPFIFFGLLIAAVDESLPFALALGAALNILANASLLPFDFGWTYWGGIRTFKGFYLFKTDLSYSLATSLLIYAAWNRYKPTPAFLILTVIAVIQVVLANSRMNYLTMLIVLVFIALKNGARPAVLAGYAVFLAILGGVAVTLYDPSKYLGFDTSNLASFTQGRDRIVEVLWKYGLANYSPLELLFGKGLYADLIIYMENISDGVVNGAHNDYLFQLTTQGFFGLGMNVFGWALLYKIVLSAGKRQWAKGLAFTAFSMYLIQAMSMTVSVFALKTWPLAMTLLLIYASSDEMVHIGQEDNSIVKKKKMSAQWGF